MSQREIDPKQLRGLILNHKEPLVFKNCLNWDIINWNLEKWGETLKDETLKFRCGKFASSKEPQWERTTVFRQATFQEFLQIKKSEEWMYFDYKYLQEWFTSIDVLKQNVSWAAFGFPELSSQDSTIWIGSAGAHTPCHSDTYGCNLVAQIYGRKQWLLFPPDENLKPTRIPYEESSIYSKLNFFSPSSLADFKGVKNCRSVILEPGDVLFVPHKWWHYVENLDVAISINTWVTMPQDDDCRLEESLVQLLISQISKDVEPEAKNIILNPNSDKEFTELWLSRSLNIISASKNACQGSNKRKRVSKSSVEKCDISNMYPFVKQLQKQPLQEFKEFLVKQGSRFSPSLDGSDSWREGQVIKLLEAATHPDVICLMKEKLLQK